MNRSLNIFSKAFIYNIKLLISEVILIYNTSIVLYNFTHIFRYVNKYFSYIHEVSIMLRKDKKCKRLKQYFWISRNVLHVIFIMKEKKNRSFTT